MQKQESLLRRLCRYLWRERGVDERIALVALFTGLPLTILGLFIALFPNEIKCRLGFRTDICPRPVDFRSLRGPAAYPKFNEISDLLEKGKFQEADQKTIDYLRWSISQEPLNKTTASKLLCRELLAIDNVWSDYSNGKFGFKAQQKVWNESGQSLDKFSQKVGWMSDYYLMSPNYKYDISAPVGHLPSHVFEDRKRRSIFDGNGFVPNLYTEAPIYEPLAAGFDINQCPQDSSEK